MPAIIRTLLSVLGSALMSMLMSLVTEKMVKKLIILGLEEIVKRTKTDADDKLLAMAKEEWEENRNGK